MDVLAFAIVLIALTAFVAAPLYGRSGASATGPSGEHTVDEARQASLAGALADLEVDHASGLLADPEYQDQLTELERRAREFGSD